MTIKIMKDDYHPNLTKRFKAYAEQTVPMCICKVGRAYPDCPYLQTEEPVNLA